MDAQEIESDHWSILLPAAFEGGVRSPAPENTSLAVSGRELEDGVTGEVILSSSDTDDRSFSAHVEELAARFIGDDTERRTLNVPGAAHAVRLQGRINIYYGNDPSLNERVTLVAAEARREVVTLVIRTLPDQSDVSDAVNEIVDSCALKERS